MKINTNAFFSAGNKQHLRRSEHSNRHSTQLPVQQGLPAGRPDAP